MTGSLVPFASPADLRTLAPSLDDAAALLVIDLISGSIRSSLGWDVDTVAGATFTVRVSRGRTPLTAIVLPAMNLTAVSALTVDDVAMTLAQYDYTPAGVIYLNSRPIFRTALVTYTAGYVRTPEDKAPPVLRAVALEYAARLAGNPEGVKAYRMGAVSETLGDDARALADDDHRLDLIRAIV